MRKKEIKIVYILAVNFLLLFLIFFFVLRLFCCSYFTLAKIHIAFSPLIFIPFLSFFTPTLSVSVCLLSLCLSLCYLWPYRLEYTTRLDEEGEEGLFFLCCLAATFTVTRL